jgi:hypothetical protein
MANHVTKAKGVDGKRTKRTPDMREKILDLLATGKFFKKQACEEAGISWRALYEWIEEDAVFAKAVIQAEEIGNDVRLKEAHRRGVDGVDRPVFGSLGGFQGTGEVGTIREYSDKMLGLLITGYNARFKSQGPTQDLNLNLKISVDKAMAAAEQRVKAAAAAKKK